MISRLYFFAFPFLLAFVTACDNNAAKSISATRYGMLVKTTGGVYTEITPQELRTLLANKNFSLVNVHVPYEGEIEKTDAVIAYNEIDEIISMLPSDKNAMVILYCRSGPMSQQSTEALVKLGYTNVWKLNRGMVGWKAAGFPIVTKRRP